ncbi:MAG TPA: type II toxin-antitoxin system RelE/ParE family toxin [Vicinamibacteria bacterium]
MFAVEIHEAAFAELEALRRYDRNRILDEIEEQLTQGPNTVTGGKKIMEAFEPPWDQVGPVWQLSVGDFRVFYDVVEAKRLVIVRAVRKKPAHRSTEEIL